MLRRFCSMSPCLPSHICQAGDSHTRMFPISKDKGLARGTALCQALQVALQEARSSMHDRRAKMPSRSSNCMLPAGRESCCNSRSICVFVIFGGGLRRGGPAALTPGTLACRHLQCQLPIQRYLSHGRDAQDDALTPALPGIIGACCTMLSLLSSLFSSLLSSQPAELSESDQVHLGQVPQRVLQSTWLRVATAVGLLMITTTGLW